MIVESSEIARTDMEDQNVAIVYLDIFAKEHNAWVSIQENSATINSKVKFICITSSGIDC